MHQIFIHNFGPIRDAEIDVCRFLILIGPQASGKSTIAKLVYYFLHVRDEVTAFVLETAESGKLQDANFRLKKRLTTRFVEFWGPTPQAADVRVIYNYTKEHYMTITLDRKKHKYITPRFSNVLRDKINALIKETRKRVKDKRQAPAFPSAVSRLLSAHERSALLDDIRRECNSIFNYEKELFFIPAGRSLLSTLSDQIQNIHPHMLDYPMREFVDTVNKTKAFFDREIDDIITEKKVLSTEKLWYSAIRKARTYLKTILRGEYRHDREGGKLFIRKDVFTKMSFASSGQQEAVWILLFLFLVVLEKSSTMVIIEEPEAHLFSDAQKDIIEFIAFVFNTMHCDFVITTHSPYLLSCVNNLLFAQDLAKSINPRDVEIVVARELWLSQKELSSYFIGDGLAQSLMTSDLPILKAELLDTASEQINEQYEKLLYIEKEASQRAQTSG